MIPTPRGKNLTMTALRVTLGLVVLQRSFVFVLGRPATGAFGHNAWLHAVSLILGWCELVAAILFLLPRTVVAGAYILVAVFVLAAALHLAHGEYDVAALLAVWTTAVLAVLAHRQPDRTDAAGRGEVVQ
jgi:hypothetical protein